MNGTGTRWTEDDVQMNIRADAQRETLFKGETLRGLLLTSYGFSVFGVKGEQVAIVSYIVAALLALLSLAGFVHAFRTPGTEVFAAPELEPSGASQHG